MFPLAALFPFRVRPIIVPLSPRYCRLWSAPLPPPPPVDPDLYRLWVFNSAFEVVHFYSGNVVTGDIRISLP